MSSEDLSKLSVGDLKKRLFFAGVTLPAGHLEKADLIAAVQKAQAERSEKQAVARTCQAEDERQRETAEKCKGVVRPDPKPLNYEIEAPGEEKEVVQLHLLSEEQLIEKIEDNGHDVPEGSSKHYLVALCRQAMKDPKPKKPKRLKPAGEAVTTVATMKRPTIGDKVEIVDSNLMRRYLPEAVGKVYRIIRDDGGSTPYRLAGLGEQRHWFSEADVKWPQPKAAKIVAGGKAAKPVNQPSKVQVLQNRYGCTAGEVRDVLNQTADSKNWVLTGGRQVPKSHEGTGWIRVEPDAPPPPPPDYDLATTAAAAMEAEMLAQMEEMQAELEAEAKRASSPPSPPPPPPQTPSEATAPRAAVQAAARATQVDNQQLSKRKVDETNPETKTDPGAAARERRARRLDAVIQNSQCFSCY